jgi:chaperonin GroEL
MVTLGPKGRNVVIEQSWGSPKITKDGVTVAKAIELSDKLENLGAQLIKSVASKTNDLAGDGTTTATTLARAIFQEGCKAVAAGMNPMDLRRGIEAATAHVVANLKKNAKLITTNEEVKQVATISANGDVVVGSLIAEAMQKVGKEGVITVQDGKTLAHEIELIEGMKFDQGYISRHFVTDPKTQECEFEDADLLLVDGKVSSVQSILPLLEQVAQQRRKLVIVAENVDGDALAVLIVNRMRGLNVAAVKAPGFGDNRKANLQDIAVLTGGTVISDEVGLKIEDATLEHLGSAKKLRITADSTLIMDGAGAGEAITERCELIRSSIERETSDYQKEKLRERLAKLSGGVAVIKIGGASEVEVNEIKDRVTDALNATRAAVDEGIVAGGGVALISASKSLVDLKTANFDQSVGVNIVRKACRVPCKTIADNAGIEGDVVVGEVLKSSNPAFGFDASQATDSNNIKLIDMFAAGIIDPLIVVRTALQDASSVAALITTTECVIVDAKEDKPAAPSGMGGGMGGMGGMGGGMGGMF